MFQNPEDVTFRSEFHRGGPDFINSIFPPLNLYLCTILCLLLPGGNAEKTGGVEVGDELIATSAVVYNTEMDYGGVKVRKGQEVVRLTVRGEKFKTVSLLHHITNC